MYSVDTMQITSKWIKKTLFSNFKFHVVTQSLYRCHLTNLRYNLYKVYKLGDDDIYKETI